MVKNKATGQVSVVVSAGRPISSDRRAPRGPARKAVSVWANWLALVTPRALSHRRAIPHARRVHVVASRLRSAPNGLTEPEVLSMARQGARWKGGLRICGGPREALHGLVVFVAKSPLYAAEHLDSFEHRQCLSSITGGVSAALLSPLLAPHHCEIERCPLQCPQFQQTERVAGTTGFGLKLGGMCGVATSITDLPVG